MSKVENCRDWNVWRYGRDVTTGVFPESERRGLANPIRRAAVSVSSNVAAGYRRATTREYRRRVAVLPASLAGVETQLEIAARLPYLQPQGGTKLLEQVQSLRRQLCTLGDALPKRI
ncbi:MAG TPA: four helix bundle protein [Bryobacteraceae bacterium]|nr:four helix bundle protein [Bryobacteraceae bacterium]